MNKKYFIYVDGNPVEVSYSVYRAYFNDIDRTNYQVSKLVENNVSSYHLIINDYDASIPSGEDLLVDHSVCVEDFAFSNIQADLLHSALDKLTFAEHELIKALYFYDLSQREYHSISGISQTTISYRKNKVLKKLRKLLSKDKNFFL